MGNNKQKNLFKTLKEEVLTNPIKTPIQEVRPIKKSKRENETTFTLWIDKELLKTLKKLAADRDTNVKELLVEGARNIILK